MSLPRVSLWLWSGVVGLATLVYVIEEWLWETLKRAMMALGHLPGIRLIESWIARLPPAGAAFFFVLPTSLALPVKLIALHLMATGHLVYGAMVIVAAKVLATALFARIYVLTQPALLRVRWFVAVRAAVLRWRDWTYTQIEAHPLWRAMHARVVRWRAELASWRSRGARRTRRWRAALRLERMRRRG
ncbi:conserved membrane hypothetical protein [Burkholderiales bacterium]|nr:conserved membrane hypothetical protein [Burkholderiales bacterium]